MIESEAFSIPSPPQFTASADLKKLDTAIKPGSCEYRTFNGGHDKVEHRKIPIPASASLIYLSG